MRFSRSTFAVVATLIVLIAIPLTIWEIRQQQIINQQAATNACGQKSTPPSSSPNFVCTGQWGTKQSSTTYYTTTWFGCYGTTGKDPNDNCMPACGNIPECNGLSGPSCERKVKWFTADAGRFGCNAKVLVTNPYTGQAVVARVIDLGPACFAEQNIKKEIIDLSFDVYSYLGYDKSNLRWAKVVRVDNAVPLGPVGVCTVVLTPTPTLIPKITPTATPTPTPIFGTFVSPTPISPTPTIIPTLSTSLTPTPTLVPITAFPTSTPTASFTPTPTVVPTNTLVPTGVINSSVVISTPTPTIIAAIIVTSTPVPTVILTSTPKPSLTAPHPTLPPTGPENVIAVGFVAVAIVIIGSLFIAL